MYLIDSNIIIGTWNIYPPAIFRTLWTKFAELIPDGDLYFHEEVKREVAGWDTNKASGLKSTFPTIECSRQQLKS